VRAWRTGESRPTMRGCCWPLPVPDGRGLAAVGEALALPTGVIVGPAGLSARDERPVVPLPAGTCSPGCWRAGRTGAGWNQHGPTARPRTGAATATPALPSPAPDSRKIPASAKTRSCRPWPLWPSSSPTAERWTRPARYTSLPLLTPRVRAGTHRTRVRRVSAPAAAPRRRARAPPRGAGDLRGA